MLFLCSSYKFLINSAKKNKFNMIELIDKKLLVSVESKCCTQGHSN